MNADKPMKKKKSKTFAGQFLAWIFAGAIVAGAFLAAWGLVNLTEGHDPFRDTWKTRERPECLPLPAEDAFRFFMDGFETGKQLRVSVTNLVTVTNYVTVTNVMEVVRPARGETSLIEDIMRLTPTVIEPGTFEIPGYTNRWGVVEGSYYNTREQRIGFFIRKTF